jgi:AcrR family transcriptional regulator
MAAKAGRKKRISPRKEPRQARAVGTVEAILQAATYILLRKGWDGLTTNRIAERAGVNIASLYQYFPNKEAIVAELMRRHVEETRAAALRVLVEHRGDDLPALVRTVVRATLAVHAVAPELHRIFTERGPQLAAGRIETALDADIRAERDRWLERATLRARAQPRARAVGRADGRARRRAQRLRRAAPGRDQRRAGRRDHASLDALPGARVRAISSRGSRRPGP